MQEKLDAILEEIKALNERISELEGRLAEQEANSVDSIYDVVSVVEEALQFSDLDAVQSYTDENVIILHTNYFRTAALANACKPSGRRRWLMHTMPERDLTPDLLSRNINRSEKGEYIVLKSHVFTLSNEFERIILDAITEGNVFFTIVTNDIESVPQSIREKMRVIQ